MPSIQKNDSLYEKLHDKLPPVGKAASFLTGASVLTANSIFVGLPIWTLGAAKVLTKSKYADDALIAITKYWINSNNAVINHALPHKDWRINMPDDLSEDKQYLLVSNHQSWVDTSIVQYISQDRLPLTRFFTKFNLIYIPVIGQAFYFLDFPMMKRFSSKAMAKNPELKKQNLIEAKRACRQLKDKPFALLNYLEGTRFTKEKHDKQGSPYQHLLKPRAGGLSLAINALGDQLDSILDVTIVYPDGTPDYDDLWKGNIRRLGVDVTRLKIPDELFAAIMDGGYDRDEATKKMMFDWLEDIWQQKDARMTKMLSEFE
ncbi:acetyltransferase [Psychrobacter sp. SZ93C1]|uniref:acetyltransferase n=1 Tax=Psychrobacter sp. SZ93C1 TaxID=2792058 RepID=UPI0018CFD8BF|nr:acetyltransferase [Psychrobacter sp. SZ93C1]MBH0065249.1 1-acyl-sn-glycerol-3-phosphate acyltransferase [Psychrobacter sp. SZ93C1]